MAANSIPLHCNICPKKPKFSDVSHLLTHVASKGHLSNYYKIKVRSGTEDASRRLVETYDRWYAEWRVEELMSERMSQKDKRKTRARPAARPDPPPPRAQVQHSRSTQLRAAVGLPLDPRLSEQQINKFENSLTSTPTPQPSLALRRQPFASRLQYWPTDSRSTSQSYTNPDYDTSSEYSDPSERRRYRYRADDSCAIEDDPADLVTTTIEDPMAVSESTKLKGVYWPGMDLFDSATPEMRRKRNQKKDVSVVEQLELNSLGVEPTELIFTPQGSFKKQRRISSSEFDEEEDEESPIKVESPRPYLTRPALANLDVNVKRTRQLLQPSPFPYLSHGQYSDSSARSAHGFRESTARRRRDFDVFQDEEVSFAQPASFNLLTAGYNHQHATSRGPAYPQFKLFNETYDQENKENIMPAYYPPTYGNLPQQQVGFIHPTYAYGLGQDQQVFHYHHPRPLYMHNAFQLQNDDNDDNRTLTAPPSPSTS